MKAQKERTSEIGKCTKFYHNYNIWRIIGDYVGKWRIGGIPPLNLKLSLDGDE
jgi:hypothetical protein